MGAIDEQPPSHGLAELRRLLPDALLELFARFFSRSARQHDAEALNAQLSALDELIHRDSDPASVFSAQLLDRAAQAVALQLADALVDTVDKIADLFIATTTDHSRNRRGQEPGVVGNNKEYARLYHRAESLVEAARMREALETLNATFDWGK